MHHSEYPENNIQIVKVSLKLTHTLYLLFPVATCSMCNTKNSVKPLWSQQELKGSFQYALEDSSATMVL